MKMKISELTDKQGNVTMDVRLIWDKADPKEMFGRKIKSVIVADLDTEKGPTAYLDIYDDDIEKYHAGDKIRIINAYSKLVQNNSGQFRITNVKQIELLGKFELK